MENINLNINQQSLPQGTYSANSYYFPSHFYYSGFIYNASSTTITAQINTTSGHVLPIISIPNQSVLKLENIDINVLNLSAGTYSYSFIGNNFPGIPKIDLQPILPFPNNVLPTSIQSFNTSLPAGTNTIGSVNIASPLPFENAVNINTIQATLTTANTSQALPSGTAYNFIIIFNKNTDTIYVGNSALQNIPIGANGSLAIDIHLTPINLASIYWVSATAGDYIEVIYA